MIISNSGMTHAFVFLAIIYYYFNPKTTNNAILNTKNKINGNGKKEKGIKMKSGKFRGKNKGKEEKRRISCLGLK